VLLFDIAQAYRLGGHVNEALRFYHKYLKADPRGSEVRTARELMAELEARQVTDSDPENAGDPDYADPERRSRSETDVVAVRHTQRTTHRGSNRADVGDAENRDDHSDDGGPPDTSSSSKPTVRADDESSDDAPADEASDPSHRRAPSLLPNARIDVGTSIANRQLSYDAQSDLRSPPPRLDTTAASVRIEGAIYPFALADEDHALAGLGLALAYDKTVGLDIHVPGASTAAAVNQSHRRVGARFRFGVGDASAFTVGLDYARRQYIIDRSGIGSIDAPDVD
jgi:hypothetical protein